jgi:hypothetical protein
MGAKSGSQRGQFGDRSRTEDNAMGGSEFQAHQ